MSAVTKKLKALLFTSQESKNESGYSGEHNRFIELVKACGIDVKLSAEIPDAKLLSTFNFLLVDLSHCKTNRALPAKVATFSSFINIVLFNADDKLICEPSALLSGIKGIFYKDDRADIILKGFESVINEESWFKRSTMNTAVNDLLRRKHMMNTTVADSHHDIVLPRLTKREKTIVHLVSRGAQNKEIAEQLHISPNTVKTHIYSLFRKTSSRNRIELITWSQKFHPVHALNS